MADGTPCTCQAFNKQNKRPGSRRSKKCKSCSHTEQRHPDPQPSSEPSEDSSPASDSSGDSEGLEFGGSATQPHGAHLPQSGISDSVAAILLRNGLHSIKSTATPSGSTSTNARGKAKATDRLDGLSSKWKASEEDARLEMSRGFRPKASAGAGSSYAPTTSSGARSTSSQASGPKAGVVAPKAASRSRTARMRSVGTVMIIPTGMWLVGPESELALREDKRPSRKLVEVYRKAGLIIDHRPGSEQGPLEFCVDWSCVAADAWLREIAPKVFRYLDLCYGIRDGKDFATDRFHWRLVQRDVSSVFLYGKEIINGNDLERALGGSGRSTNSRQIMIVTGHPIPPSVYNDWDKAIEELEKTVDERAVIDELDHAPAPPAPNDDDADSTIGLESSDGSSDLELEIDTLSSLLKDKGKGKASAAPSTTSRRTSNNTSGKDLKGTGAMPLRSSARLLGKRKARSPSPEQAETQTHPARASSPAPKKARFESMSPPPDPTANTPWTETNVLDLPTLVPAAWDDFTYRSPSPVHLAPDYDVHDYVEISDDETPEAGTFHSATPIPLTNPIPGPSTATAGSAPSSRGTPRKLSLKKNPWKRG
ncbi:hypothetical protein C8Q78DRAFT_1077226 [Trametes maxima]|nr:hypothetical protein C8Q78DRAFT_1077226 [Trametes maxima]